jgi:hypothetical protein
MVPYAGATHATAFVSAKIFQANLICVCKAGAYPGVANRSVGVASKSLHLGLAVKMLDKP